MRMVALVFTVIFGLLLLGGQITKNNHIEADVIGYNEIHEHEHTVEATSSIDNYGLNVGQKAPDFTLETLSGDRISLKDLIGKRVLLNFWASWCGPCKQEMPAMQNVYEQLKEENIEIVAINLTFGKESAIDAKKFVEKYGLTFPIPLDIKGEVQEKYHIFPIPTSYFIDEEGFIRSKYIGPMDENYMIYELNKLKKPDA